ncbi:MAG: hypothetical protein IKY76_01600 [Alistipes sp.]|nr:hypothetical protein [Alistipes sp.]
MIRRIFAITIDFAAILAGALAIIFSFCCKNEDLMNMMIPVASAFGAAYLIYILRLWVFRPKFDWHLLHGHFIRKVIILALLMPSILTLCIQTFEPNIVAANFLDDKSNNSHYSLLWSVYFHFMDPGNQIMGDSGLSRGWIGIIAVLGIFILNGFLVSSIVGWIDSRKEKWLNGEVKYPGFLSFKSHYVIIGGNDVVEGIVSQIFEAEDKLPFYKTIFRPYILIQTSRDVEEFRRELFSSLTRAQQCRIIIYYGNRNSQEDINALRCGRAKEVFILGEDTRTDDNESYHDTMNMVCLKLISKHFSSTIRGKIINRANEWSNKKFKPLYAVADDIKEQKKKRKQAINDIRCKALYEASEAAINHAKELIDNIEIEQKNLKDIQGLCSRIDSLNSKVKELYNPLKLKCRVMFEYQATFNILQVTDIDENILEFLPFNYYEMWAQKVLVCQELDTKAKYDYLPLEGISGIKSEDEDFVHLVIVGMSRMGVAMAIEAAHIAHYPNFDTPTKKRTRITFIDSNMEQEKHFFMGRFKEMFAVASYRCVPKDAKNIYNNPLYHWFNPLTNVHSKSPYKGAHLGSDFIDIEWEFIHGSIVNPEIQQYLEDASANKNAKLTIAICLPENSRAIATASYLRDSVYKSDNTSQVLIYQRLNKELVDQINGNKRYCGKLKAFGMAEECYDLSLVTISEFIASYVDKAYNDWNNGGKHMASFTDEEYYSLNIIRKIEKLRKEYIECKNEVNKIKPLSTKPIKIKPQTNDNKPDGGGKTVTAKMWSTKYNVYTMWTKFRCFGINPMAKMEDINRIMTKALPALGKMEHNRWVIEQLLLRYRPLTSNEQELYTFVDKSSTTDKIEKTKILISEQQSINKEAYAHIYICSNEKLEEINYEMPELDMALIEVLPQAYKDYLGKTESKENKKSKQ